MPLYWKEENSTWKYKCGIVHGGYVQQEQEEKKKHVFYCGIEISILCYYCWQGKGGSIERYAIRTIKFPMCTQYSPCLPHFFFLFAKLVHWTM